MLTGIILASGLSTRMGRNKLLLPYKGKPIFSFIIDSAKNSKLDHIVVVTAYEEIIEFCKREKINTVFNKTPEKGQGYSISLGVLNSPINSDYLFFVSDQPLLNSIHINQIVEFYQKNSGCFIVPKNKNTPANPKLFPNQYREELLNLSEDVRGSDIIKKHSNLIKYLPFNNEENIFMDVDTPTDYAMLIN